MYEELLKTLRDFTPFSIIVSAVVIFVVFLCVFVIFSFERQVVTMHPQLAEDIVGNFFRKPFLSAGLQGIAIDLRIKRIEYFLKLLQLRGLSSGWFTLQAAKLENKFHFCTF